MKFKYIYDINNDNITKCLILVYHIRVFQMFLKTFSHVVVTFQEDIEALRSLVAYLEHHHLPSKAAVPGLMPRALLPGVLRLTQKRQERA